MLITFRVSDLISFVDHIKAKSEANSADTLTVTAIGGLLMSMRMHSFTDVTKEALRMWIVDMAMGGLKLSTRKKYFSRLHTIYREWKSSAGQNPFEAAKDAIDFDFRVGNKEADRNLDLLDRIIYSQMGTEVDNQPSINGLPADSNLAEYRNLFLYLFYNPTATLADGVNLKFDDIDVDVAQIDEIIDEQRGLNTRSTKVFRLGHLGKTESRNLQEASLALQYIAEKAGMRFSRAVSRESLISLWIAAAIRAGVSVADIRSVIAAVPSEYSSLCLVPVVAVSDKRKREIIRQVADSVNNRPQQWFVMKMRTGQSPDSIKERIRMTTDGILDKMLFYYPTHKVVRTTAKGKPVKREVAFVPGVLFFKINRNLVTMLMNRIGDVAWCMKYSNTPGSEYCTISRNEMKEFQRCIGEFTPDVEMELAVRETPLEKGCFVKINGGGRMFGREAIVESVRNLNGTRTYTLRLTDSLLAKWTIKDIEEIYLDPVTN